jgi:hypothetical protein
MTRKYLKKLWAFGFLPVNRHSHNLPGKAVRQEREEMWVQINHHTLTDFARK